MNGVELDRDTLESIRVADLTDYLTASGWTTLREKPGRASLWAREEARQDLLIPLDRSLGDYLSRIFDALEGLARVERRSFATIIEDVRSRSEDVFRTRVVGSETEDGTLPLHRGKEVIAKTEALLEAAASAAVIRQAAFAHVPDAAKQFLRNARLGQTERGSFIVTVRSRLPELPLLPDAQRELSFEREVMTTLLSGLAAARRVAAAQPNDVEAYLKDAVAAGTSANLCSAVYSLGNSPHVSRLEFGVKWATGRPLPGNLPSSVVIERPYIANMRHAAKHLRTKKPQEQFRLRGHVRRLEREDPTVWSELGMINVLANVDGVATLVRVRLGEADYTEALHAHERGQEVSCVGVLRQAGDQYFLEEPRNFRAIP